MEMPSRSGSESRVVINRGGGPPPGYEWSVHILGPVFAESEKLFDEDQKAHLINQIQELARHKSPTTTETLDVRPILEFYELRDKGGILKRMNVRVFFDVDKDRRSIVILGIINKQNDGPTPLGDRKRMAWRLRRYYESKDT